MHYFKKTPLLGILRGIEEQHVEPLANVFNSSGLKAIEVTMNTNGAPSLLKLFRDKLDASVHLGAGTVLTLNDLRKALDAGAGFIVMPTIVTEVCEYCAMKNIPFFPGALTPNEILRAWEMGAEMVKVFPAKFFGPSYFKEVKAPLNHTRLLACGGVNARTATEYLNNGADGLAFGGSMFSQERLQNKQYADIERDIKELLALLHGKH